MPRRESYRTDDEDDDDRRAGATGGGVPAWVWVVGGAGVLTVVLCAGLGFTMFSRREAAMRQEMVRAEDRQMRVEAERAHRMALKDNAPAGNDEPLPVAPAAVLQEVSLDQIANAYRANPNAADNRYKGKRVRVRFEASGSGDGWVGASAMLSPDHPAGPAPNVIFRLPGVEVEEGQRVVIEGRCAGITTDRQAGVKLTFTGCTLVQPNPDPP